MLNSVDNLSVVSFNGYKTKVKRHEEIESSKKYLTPEKDVLEINKINNLLSDVDKVKVVHNAPDGSNTKLEIELKNGDRKTIDMFKEGNEDLTFLVLNSKENGYKFELKADEIKNNPETYQQSILTFAERFLAVIMANIGDIFGSQK